MEDGGGFTGRRSREVQDAYPGRKRRVRPQVGVVGVEPVVEERLANRFQNPLVGGAHVAGYGVVGARPFPHRAFQGPMPRADQRRHHLREPFTRRDAGQFAEMAAVFVAQFAPGLDERGAVPGHVAEMPVKAALGHSETAAQPVDLQRFDAFLGKDRVAAWIQSSTVSRLLAVVRAFAISRSLRPARGPKLTQTLLLTSHRNMAGKAGRTFSRPGHMFYCTRTTEIFSVRSSAEPGSVERADSAVKKSLRCRKGDL
jgi:hypothetical protein